MKTPQYYTVLSLAVLALALTITLIVLGQGIQATQAKLQAQQEDINRGSMSQQVGTNLLKDVAAGSQKSAKLKDVLTKSGYTVTVNASPSPSPAAATPAP